MLMQPAAADFWSPGTPVEKGQRVPAKNTDKLERLMQLWRLQFGAWTFSLYTNPHSPQPSGHLLPKKFVHHNKWTGEEGKMVKVCIAKTQTVQCNRKHQEIL